MHTQGLLMKQLQDKRSQLAVEMAELERTQKALESGEMTHAAAALAVPEVRVGMVLPVRMWVRVWVWFWTVQRQCCIVRPRQERPLSATSKAFNTHRCAHVLVPLR